MSHNTDPRYYTVRLHSYPTAMITLTSQKILDAFPELPLVDRERAVEDTHSVEHLYETLIGRTYREPSVVEYRACVDGLSLLTVHGLAYYLPGFLLSYLEDPDEADVIPSHLTDALSLGRSEFADLRTRELLTNLTIDQKAAIGLWLACYTVDCGYDEDIHRCYQAIESCSDAAKQTFPEYRGSLCLSLIHI